MASSGAIGVARRRLDGEAKVRGATRYAADLPVAGLLHARPVLSVEAHARIARIDVEEALRVPGVVAVLRAEDLPIAPDARRRLRAGDDATAALNASDAVVSGRFETPWMHQGYLEPQVATAWLEPEGDLVVSSSTQGAFMTRQDLADTLGLEHHRVRVRPAPLGGAFGGKLMIVEPLAAAAALALRAPVRLALTRSEDFAATNPAGAQLIDLEVGARADGTLTAIRGRVICDRGANADFGIEAISGQLAAGPYRWEACDIGAFGVVTNRVGFGAYRAPGAPPAAFAVESLLDELAERLGIDPIELRLRNILREGDSGVAGSPV